MIIVKVTDGLGNQMFQYAFARSLQIRSGQKVCLDVSDVNNNLHRNCVANDMAQFLDQRVYLLEQFSITLPIVESAKLIKVQRRIGKDHKLFRYCREFGLIPKQGTKMYLNEWEYQENKDVFYRQMDYYLDGYYFDKKYFEGNEKILRREFRLKNELSLSENIRKVLREKNTVSVHIRRSDFLRVGRDMSESVYYEKAINFIEDKIEHPFLMIFSDDIEWVKNNKNFEQEHMYISGKGFSDVEELVIMSMCRHHIIANSTYSYWGAWLNPDHEKIVVAPAGWKSNIVLDTWVQF